MGFNCMTREVIDRTAYHPLVARQLCILKIIGTNENVLSVSILLELGNVTDASQNDIIDSDYGVPIESEYFLYQGKNATNPLAYRIPCRKQSIRIQYLQENQRMSFDFPLKGNKIETIKLIQQKTGDFSYEVK